MSRWNSCHAVNKIFLLWIKCKSDVKETNVKEQNSVLPPIGRAETMEEQQFMKIKWKRYAQKRWSTQKYHNTILEFLVNRPGQKEPAKMTKGESC